MTETPSGADPTPIDRLISEMQADGGRDYYGVLWVERLRRAYAEEQAALAARAEPRPQPEHLCQFTQPRQPRPCPEQHPMKHEEWCGACLMQMYDPDRFAEVLKAARVLVGSSQTQK